MVYVCIAYCQRQTQCQLQQPEMLYLKFNNTHLPPLHPTTPCIQKRKIVFCQRLRQQGVQAMLAKIGGPFGITGLTFWTGCSGISRWKLRPTQVVWGAKIVHGKGSSNHLNMKLRVIFSKKQHHANPFETSNACLLNCKVPWRLDPYFKKDITLWVGPWSGWLKVSPPKLTLFRARRTPFWRCSGWTWSLLSLVFEIWSRQNLSLKPGRIWEWYTIIWRPSRVLGEGNPIQNGSEEVRDNNPNSIKNNTTLITKAQKTLSTD